MSDLTKLEDDVLDAVAAYLVNRGWKVAVIGGMKILRPDPLRAYHFEFSIGFTGRMPEELERNKADIPDSGDQHGAAKGRNERTPD